VERRKALFDKALRKSGGVREGLKSGSQSGSGHRCYVTGRAARAVRRNVSGLFDPLDPSDDEQIRQRADHADRAHEHESGREVVTLHE
jgi:hypothetical protein